MNLVKVVIIMYSFIIFVYRFGINFICIFEFGGSNVIYLVYLDIMIIGRIIGIRWFVFDD